MATRKTSVPGATGTTTPDPAPTAEIENTTGTVSEPDVGTGVGQSADSTEYTKSEDSTDIKFSSEDPRLDLILDNQKRIENKIDQLLKAGGIEAPKKKRWVQGKHGLEHKEV